MTDHLSGLSPNSIWLGFIRSHIVEHWKTSTGMMRVYIKMMTDYYETSVKNEDYSLSPIMEKLICIIWPIFFMKIICKDEMIQAEQDERTRLLFLLDENEFKEVLGWYKIYPLAKSQKDHDLKFPPGKMVNFGK